MHLYRREFAAVAAFGSVVPFMPFATLAADIDASFPQRSLTLVVGYPPGGGNDFLARLFASHMADDLGQRIIVEYRPGAASNIGAETVARMAPDGHTLYLGGRPNTIHKVMYPHLKYDFSQDLTPIGLIARSPYVMVVNKHAPIGSVSDIVSLAKTYPGGLTCASGGTGTTDHLLCELLLQEADIDMLHIPYRGNAAAFTDLMAGRVDMYITSLSAALPHIEAGDLRAIALMSPSRVPAVMDIPTIGESGFPSLGVGAWYGLLAPGGTPPHVVARLNQSINTVLADVRLRDTLTRRAYAMPPPPNSPETLRSVIDEETRKWVAVLRYKNIKPLH